MTVRLKFWLVFAVLALLVVIPGLIDWPPAAVVAGETPGSPAIVFVVLGLLMLAVLAAGFWLAKVLLNPLAQLAKNARDLAGGNHQQRLPVTRTDELGVLAGTFNQLLEALQTITLARDELAKTVQERTAELAKERAIRQAVEVELRAEKLGATALLEAMSDGVLLANTAGRVVRLNPAAEQLTGWKSSEAVGQPIGEVIHLLDENTRQPVPLPQVDGPSHNALLIDRAGGEHLLAGRWASVRDSSGMVLGLVLVFRNVSQMRQAEVQIAQLAGELLQHEARASRQAAELAENRRRYQALLANLPGMVYRRQAGRNWPLEFLSEGCCQLLGYAPDDLISGRLAYSDLIHPEDQEPFRRKLQQVIVEGSSFSLEYRVKHAGGQWRSVWEQGQALSDQHGQVIALEGCILDITRRVAAENARTTLEQQLRRAHKMEAIGTLAGGIAHDFNNVLAAILGSAELIKMDMAPDHISREFVDHIFTAGRRARELVQQLLTISHRREGERCLLDLQPVVKECVKLLRSSIPAMVDISCQTVPNCAPVLADPVQIHQVILNLCTRAWQAVPESGGIIKVKLEPCEIEAALAAAHPGLRAGPAVRLSVFDNGSGLDQAGLNQVFEPQFTPNPSSPGSGLGLSVVRDIIKDHKGAIIVESTYGHGTAFHIYLPTQIIQEEEQPKDTGHFFTGNNECIMLVDDDDMAGRVTEKSLKRTGFRVQWFMRPEEALEKFRAAPAEFDLIISDLAMPGLSGDQLAAALLEIRPDIPILVTTGLIDPDMEQRVFQIGVRNVLLKPISCEALGREISRQLPGRIRF